MDGYIDEGGCVSSGILAKQMDLSLSAMGVHKSAQSAPERIQGTHRHTHTHGQRAQVDCLRDLYFITYRGELISQ